MTLGYARFDSYDSVGYVLTLHIIPPNRLHGMTLVRVIGSSDRYREYSYSLQPYDTLCYLGIPHTLSVCYTILDP